MSMTWLPCKNCKEFKVDDWFYLRTNEEPVKISIQDRINIKLGIIVKFKDVTSSYIRKVDKIGINALHYDIDSRILIKKVR